jgi:hypothetical protein
MCRHCPVSTSVRAMNAFKWRATSDFLCKPTTNTLRDLSSMKVTKYSKPQCEHVPIFPQTSEKTRPRTTSARVSVALWISSRVCLPWRQGSQGVVRVALPVISIPFTMPFLTICTTVSVLRWARRRCQVAVLALEVVLCVMRALLAATGRSLPSAGKASTCAIWAVSETTIHISMM